MYQGMTSEMLLFDVCVLIFLFYLFFFASDRRASACRERKSPLGDPKSPVTCPPFPLAPAVDQGEVNYLNIFR